MRNAGLLGLRLTLGGHLATHGAQKLFGAFDGPGLKPVAGHFDSACSPGAAMAALAAGSELFGGILSAVK